MNIVLFSMLQEMMYELFHPFPFFLVGKIPAQFHDLLFQVLCFHGQRSLWKEGNDVYLQPLLPGCTDHVFGAFAQSVPETDEYVRTGGHLRVTDRAGGLSVTFPVGGAS